MAANLRRLAAAWRTLSPAARWRIVLGTIAAGFLIWLLCAAKPWTIDLGGPKPKLRHLVPYYTWYGAAFAFAVTSALCFITPWWANAAISPLENRKSKIKNPRCFWPLVLCAMALTAVFAYPRLDFGFWDDEELCARDSLAGKFRRDEKTDAVRFQPLKWQETFFGYITPNNHILHSICSRVSGCMAAKIAPSRELPFSEKALRLPAYFFGILSVAALAWFLKDAGYPSAGVIAAFLLALHPWHTRYASEARGYSLILLIVPLLFTFWRRAILMGSWRWWAAFAGAQFALLYTYPGTFFLLVAVNIFSLPALALARGAAKPFSIQSGRWFLVNSAAAVLAVLLMLPLVPQACIYFDHETSRQINLGWSWVRGTLSFLLAGVPWTGAIDHVDLGDIANAHPYLFCASVAGVLVLLAAGTVAFARKELPLAFLAAVVLATPVLTFILSRQRKMLIYESYVIYALPGLIALVSVGIVFFGRLFLRFPGGRFAIPAVGVLAVAVYAAGTQDIRSRLIAKPLQQIRESVLACRPSLAPDDPRQDKILTASFCIPPFLYDARMVRVDSADEFIALLEKADRSGKPLYVNIGMPWAAREYSPRMWQIFADDRLFGDRREFLGFDAGLNRLVARYKTGSAASYDFSALRGAER